MFGQALGSVGAAETLGNGSSGGGSGGGRHSRSSSGAATPTPGTSIASAFDLSDFPSLGSGSGSGNGGGGGGSGAADGHAAALRQQQHLAAHPHQHHQQFLQAGGGNKSSSLYRIATAGQGGVNLAAAEDFPALPGAPAPSTNAGSTSSGLGGLVGGLQQRDNVSAPSSSSPFVGATPTVPRASSGSGGLGLFGAEVDGMLGQKQQQQQQQLEGMIGLSGGASSALGNIGSAATIGSSRTATSTTPTLRAPGPATSGGAGSSGSSGGAALSSDYGLLGLLSIIRMTDADRNALALGSDLTALGMNLNSSDKLYSTFASPWSESPTTKEPQYQLPMCYYMQPPALKTGHLSKFQLETLFYIFYALPRDVLQAYAAQELYSREWRYHVDLKLWFKRGGPSDGLVATNGGNQYIYFDVNTLERRLFNGNAQSVTGGFLSDDDVRVKFPSS